ncbi:MAG: alpha-amylase family glycosyl hydrolase [Bacteroidales bacterium]|nr:alpha-amylase family glycosyl hydrolase [Bacteroidales bacterium]
MLYKINTIIIIILLSLSSLNTSGNFTNSLNPMQTNVYQTQPDEPVHNMSNLRFYSSFRNIPPVKSAFITAPDRLEISLSVSLPADVQISLKTYNYDSYNQQTGQYDMLVIEMPEYIQDGDRIIIENYQFDLTKNYVLDINGINNNIYLSPEIGGIIDTYFDATDEMDLGLSYSGSNAKIKVWSPPAGRIDLLMFDRNQNPLVPKNELRFKNKGKGIWEIEVKPENFNNITSLDGLFYQFKVFTYGKARLALDPYAKSMAAFDTTGTDKIGKAAIVNMNSQKAKPVRFVNNYSNARSMANEVDMIAYEVHVRDFTIQPGLLEDNISGTFKGFIQKTDYLKSLGITHVQMLPVSNFYTVDENDRTYKGSNDSQGNYNWGYDPHNYFSLEGWYSTNANDPYIRIREYRELIQSLHDKNIGIIMDVVYNHCYIVETFENVAPGCYLRYDDNLNISGTTGAGPSIECRHKMVKKLMIESLVHFVKEYHVDGFRFDLMGFHDHETMVDIRNTVGAAYNVNNPYELILQGEAWLFSDIDTDVNATGINAATTKLNYPRQGEKIGFFNDSSRDSYAGRQQKNGFVQGDYKNFSKVASGIVGGLMGYDAGNSIINTPDFNDPYNLFADSPSSCLNYLTIHDGFTLWDKLNLSIKDPGKNKRAKIMRLASAMLFTSQGKVILHGGDEILRTKPLSGIDKESHRAHTSPETDEEEGTLYFHENTYCSNDYTNMIRWDRLENEFYEQANGMLSYYKGLIQMRRQLPCLRYKNAESIKNGLVFLNKERVDSLSSSYSGFNDERLTSLEINFTNGPVSQRYFIAGEVYPRESEPNDAGADMYYVDFDAHGNGSIRFSKAQISLFDLNKWGEAGSLNIKLVKTPGQWDSPMNAYTEMGNNVINPNGINLQQQVFFDLSVKDCVAGTSNFEAPQYLAYHLDNTLENEYATGIRSTLYSELIVVHNASADVLVLETTYIENPAEWVVILDSYNAGTKALTFSPVPTTQTGKTNVLIESHKLSIPSHSAAVIAKNR